MTTEQLVSDFLQGAGDRPYRKLVEYHIRKKSTEKLSAACMGTTELLPENLRASIKRYIDVTNMLYGHNQNFWQDATCRDAFLSIIEAAIEVVPIGDFIGSTDDAFRTENQELAFNLFQITTLSFAYSASSQRRQRSFMGIRKGIFR